MIAERRARLAGVTWSLSLAIACRDAPLEPPTAEIAPPAALVAEDSTSQWPEPAIFNPYTIIGFAAQGGHYLVEYRVGMDYIGNKATMGTTYEITGDGFVLRDRINTEHDGFYDPKVLKAFDRVHYVEVPRDCGLELKGNTLHQALWIVYPRLMPNGQSKSVSMTSHGATRTLKPCEPEPEREPVEGETEYTNTTTTSNGGGGFITVTSCWYWAYIENGRVVSIEFDHCDVYLIPIDPDLGPMEM